MITLSRVTVANTTMTSANTEYSYSLPDFTKKFQVKLRGVGAPFKVAFVSGKSGTTYVNVPNGGSHKEDEVKGKDNVLYFQSPSANQVAEIISWI